MLCALAAPQQQLLLLLLLLLLAPTITAADPASSPSREESVLRQSLSIRAIPDDEPALKRLQPQWKKLKRAVVVLNGGAEDTFLEELLLGGTAGEVHALRELEKLPRFEKGDVLIVSGRSAEWHKQIETWLTQVVNLNKLYVDFVVARRAFSRTLMDVHHLGLLGGGHPLPEGCKTSAWQKAVNLLDGFAGELIEIESVVMRMLHAVARHPNVRVFEVPVESLRSEEPSIALLRTLDLEADTRAIAEILERKRAKHCVECSDPKFYNDLSHHINAVGISKLPLEFKRTAQFLGSTRVGSELLMVESYCRQLIARCHAVVGTPAFPRMTGAMTDQGDPISINEVHFLWDEASLKVNNANGSFGAALSFPPWKANDDLLETMRSVENAPDRPRQTLLRGLLYSQGQSRYRLSKLFASERAGHSDEADAPSSVGAKLKFVALVTLRNAEKQVRFFLRALSQYVDAIVVLDDHSVDQTVDIVYEVARDYHVQVLITKPGVWTRREEFHDRAVTLEKGRLIGGTHFIVIDDDEFLSQACLGEPMPGHPHDDSLLPRKPFPQMTPLTLAALSLSPGQILSLPWTELWGTQDTQRIDAKTSCEKPRNFLGRSNPVIYGDIPTLSQHEIVEIIQIRNGSGQEQETRFQFQTREFKESKATIHTTRVPDAALMQYRQSDGSLLLGIVDSEVESQNRARHKANDVLHLEHVLESAAEAAAALSRLFDKADSPGAPHLALSESDLASLDPDLAAVIRRDLYEPHLLRQTLKGLKDSLASAARSDRCSIMEARFLSPDNIEVKVMWYKMLGRILQGNTVGKMLAKMNAPLKTCPIPSEDLPRFVAATVDQDRLLPPELNVTSALGGVQLWRVREILAWLDEYGLSKFADLELNMALLKLDDE